MEFVPVASSSSGCAYLWRGRAGTLLVDCGVSVATVRKALDWRLSEVCGCLVSHGHGDHCKGVKALMSAAVDCYASAETWQSLGVAREYRAHTLSDQKEATVGPFTVKPFAVRHDAPGTFGFLVDGGGARLLYLTDTPYSPYRFEGLTHVAIEANHDREIMREGAAKERFVRTVGNHMSIDRAIETLKANDLSQVEEIWLLHLSDENSDEAEFKRRVQEATGCLVRVAPKAVPA